MMMRTGRIMAGTVFSTAFGFLVMALVWHVCSEPTAFVSIAAFSIVLAAMYGSLTVGAELNWPATLSGSALGLIALGLTWFVDGQTPSGPVAILAPIALATAAVAVIVEKVPRQESVGFLSGARFVSLIHLLQGVFLFGVLLPACLAWEWPRPFAAALICSAFVLWEVWADCPLNIAENKLRIREGKATIPSDQGFTSHVLGRLGMPVSDKAITAGLHALGVSLCAWWGVQYLMT